MMCNRRRDVNPIAMQILDDMVVAGNDVDVISLAQEMKQRSAIRETVEEVEPRRVRPVVLGDEKRRTSILNRNSNGSHLPVADLADRLERECSLVEPRVERKDPDPLPLHETSRGRRKSLQHAVLHRLVEPEPLVMVARDDGHGIPTPALETTG